MIERPYVYLHLKSDGTPFHVGKGSGRRAWELRSRRNRHHRNVVAKYGRKNIEVLVFPRESDAEAFETERIWIAVLREAGFILTNKSNGGEGAPGYRHDAETIEKIKAARQKQSPPALGYTWTAETRAKQSAARRGKKWTAETRAKMSVGRIGLFAGERHPMFGKHHNALARAQMSIANWWARDNLPGAMPHHGKDFRALISGRHLGKFPTAEEAHAAYLKAFETEYGVPHPITFARIERGMVQLFPRHPALGPGDPF